MANQDEVSEEFMLNYRKFIKNYDDLVSESLFLGLKVEELCKKFLRTNETFIRDTKFSIENCKFPHCSYQQTLDEDLEILESRKKPEAARPVPQRAELLAEVYWRASQACYLRITYNKSRLNQEDDRGEAVELSRFSLRFNPQNFKTCYWYMITLGWQLDHMSSPREKTLVSRIFKQSARRCIELKPQDPLAHNLLGRYYYNVACLSWLERTLAGKLLGAKLEGSFEDSEREFKLAHQLSSEDWLPTGLWMARVSLGLGRSHKEALQWIDYSLKLKCLEPSSELERRQLLELRRKLSD